MQNSDQLREEAWACLREARATSDRDLARRLAAKALELTQLAEALAHLRQSHGPDAPAREAGYRIYFLFGGHFVAAHDFLAQGDNAALALAYALQDACSDGYDDFELWQGGRLIAGNAVSRRRQHTPHTSDVTARMQEDLLATEEALLSSRRAIAQSRKLLQSIERLRHEIGRRD
jgi:hypothetical protein